MLHISSAAQEPAASNEQKGSIDPEFERAQLLSRKALHFAESYQTPPVPKTFEVWYAYSAGEPAALRRELGAVLEKKKGVDSYDMWQLHAEYLSGSEQERRQQEVLGYHLDREMEKAVQRVHRHLATNEHYSGSLKKSATKLASAATAEQVRETVEVLLMENARMRAESVRLNHDLEQTRVQVRKLRSSLEKSRENEFRDALTNVSNRRFFDRVLNKAISEANATGSPLSLVLADLDHFKRINDTFGHQVGDDVLRYFAALMMKNVKGQDLVARYGGEEFAIILPATTVTNAHHLVTQMMEQLAKANLVVSRGKDSLGKVTCSFGIAELHRDESASEFIQRADERLYQAKHAGRNRAVCDPAR